jgi:hypothetical protein
VCANIFVISFIIGYLNNSKQKRLSASTNPCVALKKTIPLLDTRDPRTLLRQIVSESQEFATSSYVVNQVGIFKGDTYSTCTWNTETGDATMYEITSSPSGMIVKRTFAAIDNAEPFPNINEKTWLVTANITKEKHPDAYKNLEKLFANKK